ncbi:hypothetical protein JCM8097_007329 [Rhodosporidiobolus ruineniae]
MPLRSHGSKLAFSTRGKLVAGLCALLLLLQLFRTSLCPSSSPSSPHHPGALPRPLVSLTSTRQRLSTSLPPTVWSLVRQSLPPRAVRIHLPLEQQHAFSLADLDPVFRHPLVELRFVEDEGPATKFLPALREALETAANGGDLRALDDPVVVLDDDHVYSPVALETLARAWVERGGRAAVGSRGWRVREDRKWGVSGWEEVRRHVVEGWRIRKPYRVGVVTANEAYMVAPSFFLPPSTRTLLSSLSTPSRDFPPSPSQQPPPSPSIDRSLLLPLALPLFSPSPGAPQSLHLVDDLHLSGCLALSRIARFVVPLPPPDPPSLDITPPSRTAEEKQGGPRSPLEHHLREHGKTRAEANDEALGWYGDAFGAERDEEGREIWYDMRSAAERRADVSSQGREPDWAGWGGRTWSEVSKWAYWRRARGRWGEKVWWN